MAYVIGVLRIFVWCGASCVVVLCVYMIRCEFIKDTGSYYFLVCKWVGNLVEKGF